MTEDKNIDFARAKQLIESAIAVRGEDYVYESFEGNCFYSDHSVEEVSEMADEELNTLKPGCIFGLALTINGLVELRQIAKSESRVAATLRRNGYDLTDKAAFLMEEVQRLQDRGYTWGSAYKRTLNEMSNGIWSDEI